MTICVTHTQETAPIAGEQLDSKHFSSHIQAFRAELDRSKLAPLDAVIHGTVVRLHTNSPHWHRFWSANWFAPQQWAALTGNLPPTEPQVHIYASNSPQESVSWSGYHLDERTAFLRGDVPYGPLRSLALAMAGRLLAEDQAVHLVPGICAKVNGRGTIMLRAPSLDLPTALGTATAIENLHLCAVDGVLVRYGLVRMVDGVTMLPTTIIDEKGYTLAGYRLFPWLDAYGYWEPRADARCLTLKGEETYCFARDLDLGRTPEAFAFPVEQAWYVPTQIVANDPALIGALWSPTETASAKEPVEASGPAGALGCHGLENVPPLTPALWEAFGAWATDATSTLTAHAPRATQALLDTLGARAVAEALCRLRGSTHARALASPQQLWPGNIKGNPAEPVLIERILVMDGQGLSQPEAADLFEQLGNADISLPVAPTEELTRALGTMLARATLRTD
jgi:hypothetical protein